MAYGLKYELLCRSQKSNNYKLKIYFDGYVGSAIDRDMPASNAIVLRKDKAAVVRGTSCEFSIREIVDFEFLEFYTNNQKKIKVEFYKETTLLWVGYNLQQQYQVPYVPSPVNVQFSATDGLGLLKNEPFALTGLNSQLATIIYCIDKIGLGLGYSIAVNLFEVTHDHTRSPLAQTYETGSVFAGMTCYDVIDEILGKYSAEITQVNGRWHITRSTDKKSTRMLYTSAGVYETTQAAPAVLDLGYPGAGIEVSPVGSLSMGLEPGGKQVRIVHNYNRKNSLLTNADFSEYDSSFLFPSWSKHFDTDNFANYQRFDDLGPYCFIPGNSIDNDYIYQQIDVENVPGEDFSFSVEVCPLGYWDFVSYRAPLFMTVKMMVTLVSGVNIRYLTKENGWSSSPADITEYLESSMATPNFRPIKILTGEIPFSGTLSVCLFRYESGLVAQKVFTGIAWRNINAVFLKDNQLYVGGLDITATFDDSTEPTDLPDITIISADAPALANAALLYKNITRLATGVITGLWHRLGSAVELSLIEQLALTLASDNKLPRQKLAGIIKGPALWFNSIVKHAYNNNREFEIAEGSFDVYNERWSVTLLEILTWSDESVTLTPTNTSFQPTGEGSSSGTGGAQSSLSAATLLEMLLTVDGDGSGVDADLLDGQHANVFAPKASPTFTGTVVIPILKVGDFYFEASGTTLYLKYGATVIATWTSAGYVRAKNEIEPFASI